MNDTQNNGYFSNVSDAQPSEQSAGYFAKVSGSSPTTPSDVNVASDDLGDQSYSGYCQQFVEQVAYGKTGLFPSASNAWDTYQQTGQAKQGIKGIQPGDLVYFAPDESNGYDGHTGIYTGNNNFISATYNGVASNNLDKWQQSTGQKVLGYVKNPGNLPQIGEEYGPQ